MEAYIHASELLTGESIRSKDGRQPQEKDLGRIEDGAVVYQTKTVGGLAVPTKIIWVGKTQDLPKRYLKAKIKNLKNRHAVTPGWIDCHTHLVFAGNRSDEFARRCAGESYESIAAQGGGILSTIHPTRMATEDELFKTAELRIHEAWSYGVRVLEIKSGYGLCFDSEVKTLKVIQKLKKKFPQITFRSTFLGAHAFPPGVDRYDYIQEIIQKMIPFIGKKHLADSCDVFVDQGYFTVEEAKLILTEAKKWGLTLHVHADELECTESAQFAVQMKALSADHLLRVNRSGMDALAKSNTVAVLLPATAYYLKAPYAPARELITKGACVAISTDFNPGSSMCNSLPQVMNLSALYMEMSRAEIFAGVTYNAAKALGIENDYGTIEVGKAASMTVLPFDRFEQAYYHLGWSPVAYPSIQKLKKVDSK
ncbi:MAG: imidazolonepropionase [Bdellovibrionaceae bacterium]|nr:imidazolonepropionase [Pseudobdellovibrionaceae bacterium]